MRWVKLSVYTVRTGKICCNPENRHPFHMEDVRPDPRALYLMLSHGHGSPTETIAAMSYTLSRLTRNEIDLHGGSVPNLPSQGGGMGRACIGILNTTGLPNSRARDRV